MQAKGMIDLLYGYVPALFVVVCHVQDYRWRVYANSNMSIVLYSRCLHALMCVTVA